MKNSIKLIKETTSIIRDINSNFDLSDNSLHLLLLGHKVNDKYIDELKNNVPQDLIKFRYLMHPTRLMIVKLLHSEYSLASVEIKNILNIPWGDFGSHTKSLEKYGYIEIKDQFTENGSVRQVLFLTIEGKNEFEQLLPLLQDFITDKTPLQYLLSSDVQSYMKDDLYPSE